MSWLRHGQRMATQTSTTVSIVTSGIRRAYHGEAVLKRAWRPVDALWERHVILGGLVAIPFWLAFLVLGGLLIGGLLIVPFLLMLWTVDRVGGDAGAQILGTIVFVAVIAFVGAILIDFAKRLN